jgi:hypothetical protein
MVHWNDRVQSRSEHPLPLFLPNLLAVVCPCCRLRRPFLLIVCLKSSLWCLQPGKVVEVVFIPCRADFLQDANQLIFVRLSESLLYTYNPLQAMKPFSCHDRVVEDGLVMFFSLIHVR